MIQASDLALVARIRAKREREGLSLRQAGTASGVAFSTLARIEQGKTPSLNVYQRIEAWLEGNAPLLPTPPMTLRDWFAGQALTRIYASGGRYTEPGLQSCAKQAYAMADAMLAERTKSQ